MRILCLILAIIVGLAFIAPFAIADEEGAQKVLKQGVLGAGVGAIAASASGGKAGKGALIGAGANIAGGVIMDAMSGSPSQASTAPVSTSRAEVSMPYQQGYNDGYQTGFESGYDKGYAAGLKAAR